MSMKQPLREALAFFSKNGLEVHHAAHADVLVFGGAEKAEYEAYLEHMLQAEYTLHAAHSIGCNHHAALLHSSHVIHAYCNENEPAVRVVFDPSTALPAPQPMHACSGGAVLYQFETDHTLIDCGMCYIIQCADGSFFIIDSAHYYSFNDNGRIHKFLRERTPAGEKIVIAGWYFSHSHVDHVGKFMDFLRYNSSDVVIEALYFNFVPSEYFLARTAEQREDEVVTRNFYALVNAHPDIPKITLHTGQRFFVRNLAFEVLYTHEDVYPNAFDDYNTSSSVLRMTVGDTQVIFPGDASGIASDILVARYGDLLRCDILQVSHHGHFGLSSAFYEKARAGVVMFPTTQIKYDEEFAVFAANRTAVALSEQCFISSNGTIAISLPYHGEEIALLGDETFEDFTKIKGLWGYEYSEQRKRALWEAFTARGGKPVTLFQKSY